MMFEMKFFRALNNLSTDLRRQIMEYYDAISDAIEDYSTNGKTLLHMYRVYGFPIYQRPMEFGVIGFRTSPTWSMKTLSYLLEHNASIITNEYFKLKNQEDTTIDKKFNKIFYLIKRGETQEQSIGDNNIYTCPQIFNDILNDINICNCHFGNVYFQVLPPKSIVKPKYGLTNLTLTIQIPLLINSPHHNENDNDGNFYLTINSMKYNYQEGKAIVIDDSFLHSITNNCDFERVIFSIDIWHPDLTVNSRKQLSKQFKYNSKFLDRKNQKDLKSGKIPCKGLLLGDSYSGKAALLHRFMNDEFCLPYGHIGIDFKIKMLDIEGYSIKFMLFLTNGMERCRSIDFSYIKGSHIVFIIMDLTENYNGDNGFYSEANYWYNEIITRADEDVVIALIGTKSDLENKRTVSHKQLEQFANEKEIIFFETSSKEGTNVHSSFITAIKATTHFKSNTLNYQLPSEAVSITNSKKCLIS